MLETTQPDDVLFEGGAGEIVQRKLLETADSHYSQITHRDLLCQWCQGKRLVLGCQTCSKDPWTREVWVYDYREECSPYAKEESIR